MKIMKMCVVNGNYYCVFDEIPELKYERIGRDYVGSACDKEGGIIFSHYLGHAYSYYLPAFGGRELTLKMKDGTERKIKDHWFDLGYCPSHGEFIHIGVGTLEKLQKCYVYYGMNINKFIFQKMLDDYYMREREYSYDDIENWANMQRKLPTTFR